MLAEGAPGGQGGQGQQEFITITPEENEAVNRVTICL